jgi:O-antigen ligase
VYVVPFLPLYVSGSLLFPYVSGRGFAFRILIELLVIPLAALWWISKRHRPPLTPLTATLLAFVATVAVADLLGVSPSRSIWSTYERMDGLLLLLHLAAFYVLLRVALETQTHWRRFFTLSVAAAALAGAVALVEFVAFTAAGQVSRPGGPTGNPGLFAGYVLLHLFVCALLLAGERRPRVRALLMTAMGLGVVLIYLSGTRAALLAVAVAAPAAAVAWHGLDRVRTLAVARSARAAAIVIIVTTALLLVVQRVPLQEGFARRVAGVDQPVRLITWRAAWNTIRERPWLGWGQENFYLGWDRYFAPTGEPSFDRAHSMPLEWLLAGGVVVLAAWIILGVVLARAVWRLARHDRQTAVAIGGLLAAYGVYALFWFDALSTSFLLVAVMAFVDWSLRQVEESPRREERAAGTRWHAVTAAAVTAAFALPAIYLVNVRPMLAARDTVRGLRASAEGRLAESRTWFEAALASQGLRFPEIVEQMGAEAVRVLTVYGEKRPAEAKAFADRAIRELQDLTAQPLVAAKDLRLLGALAGAVSVMDPSRRPLAVASFNRALALSADPQTYTAMASYYAAAGEFDAAFAAQRKAIALAPANPGLQFDLVRLAFRAGVASEADYAAARRFVAAQANPASLAAEYVTAGEFELALIVVDEMLSRDPGNAQLRSERDLIARRASATRRP